MLWPNRLSVASSATKFAELRAWRRSPISPVCEKNGSASRQKSTGIGPRKHHGARQVRDILPPSPGLSFSRLSRSPPPVSIEIRSLVFQFFFTARPLFAGYVNRNRYGDALVCHVCIYVLLFRDAFLFRMSNMSGAVDV